MPYPRHRLPGLIALALLLAVPGLALGGSWSITDRENPELPGRRVDVKQNDRLVASLIYGEGQMKSYLHVYGEEGERLTNPGVDADGEEVGLFPHHRGIYIGWNRIRSDLGTDDLWHMRGGERIELIRLEHLSAGPEGATIVAKLHWLSASSDDEGGGLLLEERREMKISRPDGERTRVDTTFVLRAARDLELGGDLQHAGIHFRADDEVAERREETAYAWEPDLPGDGGRIVHDEHKWVQFLFPIGQRWYTALQLDAPTNPTTELSWRDYGRFGYFFKDELAAGEERTVHYRFLIEAVDDPETALDRSAADAHYRAYAETF